MSSFFSPKFLLLFTALILTNACVAQFSVSSLKTNYQDTPLGIDVTTPVFSWQMATKNNLRAQYQTAYQINVSDEAGVSVWNSGKIASSSSTNVSYKGSELKAATRYTYQLTVWDQKGKMSRNQSWFETGLMNSDSKLSSWNDAKWIGGTAKDMVFYPHYLTVFKLKYDLQLDESTKTTKASFLFGANDERLMNQNLNTKGMLSKRDSSYVKVELDITAVDGSETGKAKLNIYRVGYIKTDNASKPLYVLSIPLSVINKNNRYQKHQIAGSSVFGVFDFYIDGTDAAHTITLNNNGQPASINLNPVGWGGDYITYPVIGDIGFASEKGQIAHFSHVSISNHRSPSKLLFQENLKEANYKGIFANADKNLLHVANNQYNIGSRERSAHIIANPTQNSSPMLRTEFTIANKEIKKARIYATARGVYELYLNGERVGDEYFNPGLTQYDKTHLYQTYDVTSVLKKGTENAIGALLSEGWWSGNITYTGSNWNFFGDRQSFLAKVVITYTDGTEQIIATNPETWKYYNDGPIVYSSFFQGEVYDARKELQIKDWDKPGFDDQYWTKTIEIGLDSTASKDRNYTQEQDINKVFQHMKLLGMPGVTAKIIKTIKPISVEEVRPGVFIYDMGQNMVGFPKIKLAGVKKGDTIMMRYGEIKYPDLEPYKENKGMVMLENLRAAMVRDIFYCNGSNDLIQPRFTSHGFRYLEITGIKKAIPLENITGMVLSSITTITANYESSNALVNRFWGNIIWSTLSNFLLIPTDTPARNERMGWSGDISVFSKTATYLADLSPFLNRHMLAMRDLQYKNGRFTDTAPVSDAFGGILWGSAGIVVAWETYQQYNDPGILADHYEAMKQYVSFLKTRINPANGTIDEGPLGDWLSPENYKNDDTILWDAYYVYDLDVMRKVAALLEKSEDAKFFEKEHANRKAHFNKTHMDAGTGKTLHTGHRFPWGYQIDKNQLPEKGGFSDTQASYAVPLSFGVLDSNLITKATANLSAAVRRENKSEDGVMRPGHSLMTGFIGTAAISNALSKGGNHEDAYRLLQQTSYPSWLYSVENGATTIWERLNSYTKEDGFGTNNSMNSFNHYSFGAVGAWMINYSLGIARDEPGFSKFILQPSPDPTGQMTFAKGYYDSIYGRIASEWKLDWNQVTYDFIVPANTSATLYLNGVDINKVTEGGKKIDKLIFKGQEGAKLKFALSSGKYHFVVKK
ncbi:MAG: alpha-L-rhamnosidase [Pedobacter sp.]|nr:MAG: alpha-L-rhamnosidase [Pedobacter sp.]